MQHPPLTGHGDPGNFASKDALNNIEYPAVESANGQLPAIFSGMTINVTGLRAYQQTASADGPYTVVSPSAGLDMTDANASPMAFEGVFTGGGAPTESYYLIGPAYRDLLAALEAGSLEMLQAWYNQHFTGSEANWQNFINGFNFPSAIAALEANALKAASGRLPHI